MADVLTNHLGLVPDRVNPATFLSGVNTHFITQDQMEFILGATTNYVLTSVDAKGNGQWQNPAASVLDVFGQQFASIVNAGPIAQTGGAGAFQTALTINSVLLQPSATYLIQYGMNIVSTGAVTNMIAQVETNENSAGGVLRDNTGVTGYVGQSGVDYSGTIVYTTGVFTGTHSFIVNLNFGEGTGGAVTVQGTNARLSVYRVA